MSSLSPDKIEELVHAEATARLNEIIARTGMLYGHRIAYLPPQMLVIDDPVAGEVRGSYSLCFKLLARVAGPLPEAEASHGYTEICILLDDPAQVFYN